MADRWDAIVVAGGRGSRLGGVSKPELVVGGSTLLERALDAVAGAASVVVVGGPRAEGVRWTVEEPAGGGPAAAVAAGIAELAREREPAPVTAVLGVDTPLAGEVLPPLLDAAADDRGAWAVDAGGFAQQLLAVYPTSMLAERCTGDLAGTSLRRLVEGIPMAGLSASGDLARDLDTREDEDYWKERLG
ncbi:NTP transferase domain-containing protein [Demequina sp. SYSU T00192]|uniref:NTP transferase domain-containing protein n=1 Tax=Demequina litoralis TaxID=3051660 RepID=A0ABT8GBL0_9MICO|nr:NTP transferase domain-containing protein [Demequina sp. SYSU T00192]MDN4476535.1 NTP transferase domain-containing protein [Demequina sp. SYSU T00192]